MPRLSREDFSTLVLSYLGDVTAFARHLSRNDWDADDLVQGTYERAFRAAGDLGEPGRSRAWLFRIARNLHIDRIRRAAARPEIHLVDGAEMAPGGTVVSPETVERLTARELEAALDGLPEPQRQALLLCDLWGFRYEEIAEITGAPLGTVRSRIARARGSLASSLATGTARHRRGMRR